MSAVENGQQERRVASFRIEDILARPHGQSAHNRDSPEAEDKPDQRGTAAISSPAQPLQLTFGVDQILASRESESRGRLQCYGPCDQMYSAFWSPSLLTTHAQPYLCSTLPHSNCEACYGAASYQYLATGYTGIYEDYRSSMSKTHLVQALPGQPKPRKPRRPWTRAVFSNLQRKGLEKRFQVQKYLTKADRHQLASMLGLTDNQVKVWFQNRRMKWRQDARESVTGTGDEETEKQS